MRNTTKILDRARDMCSPPTDYQLAKRLEVPRATVSNWRRGINSPDNQAAWKLAKILGLPTTDVIAYFEADRARDPTKRAWWESQLPRALPSIAIASASLLAIWGTLIGGHQGGTHAMLACNLLFLQPIYYAQFAALTIGAVLIAIAAQPTHPGTDLSTKTTNHLGAKYTDGNPEQRAPYQHNRQPPNATPVVSRTKNGHRLGGLLKTILQTP